MSVYTVVALTIERYHCLKDQKIIDNDKNKLKIIVIYIVLLWISAICFTLTKTVSIRVSDDQAEMFNNDCMSSFDETDEKIFTTLKLLIAFAIPYTTIIVFSIFLLKFLNEWSKRSQNLRANKTNYLIFNTISNLKLENSEENTSNKIKNQNKLTVPTAAQLKLIEPSPSNQSFPLTDLTKVHSNYSINSQPRSESDKQNLENTQLKQTHLNTLNNNNNYKSCEITNVAASAQSSKPMSRHERIKRRSTKFVISVVISFLCCWSPLWLFQLIMSFFDPKNSNFMRVFNNLTLIVVYCSCVFNPLLYMLLTENFREYAKDILKKVNIYF